MIELDDRRVLGAFDLRDGTTELAIRRPLDVEAGATRLVRNRRGVYVVLSSPGLETHTEHFEAPPPGPPPIGSLEPAVTITDHRDEYLPTRATLSLPRAIEPPGSESARSIFRPQRIPMLPSPAAPTLANWARLRLRVTDQDDAPVGGALVRVTIESEAERVVLGLSEWRAARRSRGEALVALPGIPRTHFGDGEAGGPVLSNEIEARVEVAVDPVLDVTAGDMPVAPVLEARLIEEREAGENVVEPRLRIAEARVRLAAGREDHLAVTVDLS